MACAPACGARAPEPAWPRRRPGGTDLGRDLVFGGRGFDVFQLQFHLIEELTAGLGTAAIELPPHLLYGKLEMGDQRLGAGDIGRRTRGRSRSARGLRLRVNARGALRGKEPFEAFQIIRQAVNRRRHGCEWSTDRVIRDLGIGQMSQNATGSSRCCRPPCALRVPPVNALQHVGELRRRDDNDAIGRRGPDELVALQPLGVERHAQSVMPKHLHEVAPAPTEHKEIAGMRIALQRPCRVRPFMPRRISVWPVAIHTRTPEEMGIIAAAVPSSPPPPVRIDGPGNTQTNAAPKLQLDQRYGRRRRGWSWRLALFRSAIATAVKPMGVDVDEPKLSASRYCLRQPNSMLRLILCRRATPLTV